MASASRRQRGLAEWLHSEARRELGIPLDQGSRYSWGHEKVWRLLGLGQIGMILSDGYAVLPEQSTVAIMAHDPLSRLLRNESRLRVPEGKATNELITDTARSGKLTVP